MDSIKQNIKGDGNTTIVNTGISPEDAYQIALSLFKENFPVLQQEASETVRSRVDELFAETTKKIYQKGVDGFSSFKEPDMQYALYESMKSYARYGTKELLDVLSELVADRAGFIDDLKVKVAIDDAIGMVQKMTQPALNYLTMVFICKQVKMGCVKNANDLISMTTSLVNSFPFEAGDVAFLDSIGCFRIDLDKPSERLAKTYEIKKESLVGMFPNCIDELPHDYSLTYPAIVLAIVNAKNKRPDIKFDLKTWIR